MNLFWSIGVEAGFVGWKRSIKAKDVKDVKGMCETFLLLILNANACFSAV